jgi:hypothetical protein
MMPAVSDEHEARDEASDVGNVCNAARLGLDDDLAPDEGGQHEIDLGQEALGVGPEGGRNDREQLPPEVRRRRKNEQADDQR